MALLSTPRRLPVALAVLVLLLTPLLAVAWPQPAAAAGNVVTCTEATLRAALQGGGLVTFSCSGMIPIASQLEITQDTIIDGGGQVTLDGQGASRLFVVNAGVELELNGITLRGGSAPQGAFGGGAVLNYGTLSVNRSTLTGNRADFGGAIDNEGALTLTASTLSGNTATQGGGAIENSLGGVVTITSSTLSDNGAQSLGGAIFNSGTLTLSSSTLAGNSANQGGAIFTSGLLTINASTLSGNIASGGWMLHRAAGTATLTASILSGGNLCNGSVTSGGANVASDVSCGLTASGDVQNVNPLLGPLMFNGGPTDTMLPQPGSPALLRVPIVLCATVSAANNGHDQRGATRPESHELPCDSGAVELQVNNFFCVGEHSGGLRYVNLPFGCGPDEQRLLSTADGLYAFCVGEHSESMRYLFNADGGCLGGEWKLVLPQVEPITICVYTLSRTVDYAPGSGACDPRFEHPYQIINPAG